MPDVNPPDAGSTLRGRQKQATTAAILDAARTLFRETGFGAVTIARIAAQAGVSQETIYQRFGNKAALLHAVIQRAVHQEGADGTGIPALVQAMIDARNPVEQTARWASLARLVNESAWDLFEVTRAAALADPETAARWDSEQQWRYEAQEKLAGSLSRRRALRSGLSVRVAADQLWTLCGHDLYRLLAVERGWTADAYEEWLLRTCRTTLLRDEFH